MEVQAGHPAGARPEQEAHGVEFLFGAGSPAVVFPDRLEDHLTLLRLPASSRDLFRLLYRFARWSLSTGQVTSTGQIRIWPKLDALTRLTAVSRRTLQRNLQALVDAGLCERGGQQSGVEADCLLWPIPVLLDRLDARPGAQEALQELHPEAYDPGVLALETHFASPSSTHWIMQQHARTKALLGAVDKGTAQHAAALATRQAKAAAKPTRLKPKKKAEGPVQWGEQLRAAIKDGLESVWQPTLTKKDLTLLKRLAAELDGHATLQEFFTWVCDKGRWPRFRRRFRMEPEVMPTAGILWAFRASLIPAFLNDQRLAVLTPEEVTTDPQALDFVHSYR